MYELIVGESHGAAEAFVFRWDHSDQLALAMLVDDEAAAISSAAVERLVELKGDNPPVERRHLAEAFETRRIAFKRVLEVYADKGEEADRA